MYTRQMVLENLPPPTALDYNAALNSLAGYFETTMSRESVKRQFHLETLLRNLTQKPGGCDFVLPYRAQDGLRYKQVNVLWGDQNHKTVCLVRSGRDRYAGRGTDGKGGAGSGPWNCPGGQPGQERFPFGHEPRSSARP